MGTEQPDTVTPSDDDATTAAGEGLSDSEMIDQVADQTDSASPNADTAGRDWNGESDPPEPPD
ncbi:MAG: hypothetical protein WKF47_18695 [Geodermatophilaceae bacterium]